MISKPITLVVGFSLNSTLQLFSSNDIRIAIKTLYICNYFLFYNIHKDCCASGKSRLPVIRFASLNKIYMNLFTRTGSGFPQICSFFILASLVIHAPLYLGAQLAPNAQYATFSGGLSGIGTFSCDQPDFNYSITGDFDLGNTQVPAPSQTIDNNGGEFEIIYGSADIAENIEVEVAAYFGNVGEPISNTVTTTLDFISPIAAGELAFMIVDVEQDQVMVCALDENGVQVPVSTIATWFQGAFDADNSDFTAISPAWDEATGTLVGAFEPSGEKQFFYVADLPDNEAGSAWFETTVAISQLQFKSQSLGIAPDDPSQHFFFASRCTDIEPEPEPDTAIPTMGEWGLICLSILMLITFLLSMKEQESRKLANS